MINGMLMIEKDEYEKIVYSNKRFMKIDGRFNFNVNDVIQVNCGKRWLRVKIKYIETYNDFEIVQIEVMGYYD